MLFFIAVFFCLVTFCFSFQKVSIGSYLLRKRAAIKFLGKINIYGLSSRRANCRPNGVYFFWIWWGTGLGEGVVCRRNRVSSYLFCVFLGARLFLFRFQHVLEVCFRCPISSSVLFLLFLRRRLGFAAEEIGVRRSPTRIRKLLFYFCSSRNFFLPFFSFETFQHLIIRSRLVDLTCE